MGRGGKCKPCDAVPEWLLTYGDMITLVLTFFVLLYVTTPQGEPSAKMDIVLSAFSGLGNSVGGNTLSPGKLAELGNSIMTLPAVKSGQSLGESKKIATSLFEPEIKRRAVLVTQDERGLVISLSADAFFDVGSAEIRREEAREVLRKVGILVSSEGFRDKKVRFEGHTDDEPTDPAGKWPTNWHLGAERAVNALIFTAELNDSASIAGNIRGMSVESRFHATSYSHYHSMYDNSTRESRALNRRVDVIILNDGVL